MRLNLNTNLRTVDTVIVLIPRIFVLIFTLWAVVSANHQVELLEGVRAMELAAQIHAINLLFLIG